MVDTGWVSSGVATLSRPVRERLRKVTAGEGVYSDRLARVARFSIRHKVLVIGAWVVAAGVLAAVFPQLETVVKQQSVNLIPSDAPSLQTVERMGIAFGEQGSKTTVFVAVEEPTGLSAPVRQRYNAMVSRLRADSKHVRLVQDLLADPVTAGQAVSQDGKAWYLPVGIAGTLGDPRAAESVQAVRAIAANSFSGTSTTVRVTGPPATFSDQIDSAEQDLIVVSVVTAGLIALILLVIYRSLFTALLPLLVIGVSLG